MATYRFRVTFEDYDDISRDIEIRSTQTFDEFHYAIQNAIGFDSSQTASFYFSDDNWKKGKEFTNRELNEEDQTAVPLKNSRLCDYIIDPHQKIYYVFDPAAQWTFHIELIKINREEEMGVFYPRCVKSSGEAPKQYKASGIAIPPVPDEDFDIAIDDEADETEETEELLVVDSDLPEGEEKDEFIKTVDESSDEFETADGDISDEETTQDADDF